MNFDPETHAKAGHTVEITSVPMYCVTCDIYLNDNKSDLNVVDETEDNT